MILATYEQMRVNFALTEYGPTPTRGTDGRFLFPTDVVAYPSSGMLARNVGGATVADSPSAAAVIPWDITANARAADSVARTDEWDWYLWHEAGWLELRRRVDETLTTTYSGSAWLYLTVAGLAQFQDASVIPPDAPAYQATVFTSTLRRLLRSTYVYAQRRSDGRVYVFDLSALVFGGSVGVPTPED